MWRVATNDAILPARRVVSPSAQAHHPRPLRRRAGGLPARAARPAGAARAAAAHGGERVQLRPDHAPLCGQGVSESARLRTQHTRRRATARHRAPGVLRLLRLALVGARPLDAGEAPAAVPVDSRRRPQSSPHSIATSPPRTSPSRPPTSRGRARRRSSGCTGGPGRSSSRRNCTGLVVAGSETLGATPAAADHRARQALPRLPAEADVSDTYGRPSEHGVRARGSHLTTRSRSAMCP